MDVGLHSSLFIEWNKIRCPLLLVRNSTNSEFPLTCFSPKIFYYRLVIPITKCNCLAFTVCRNLCCFFWFSYSLFHSKNLTSSLYDSRRCCNRSYLGAEVPLLTSETHGVIKPFSSSLFSVSDRSLHEKTELLYRDVTVTITEKSLC